MGKRAIGLAVLCTLVGLPLAAPEVASADGPTTVVINEIHYHPLVDGEEFLELTNTGAAPVDVSGACFTAGISGCLPADTSIPAGGFVLVAELPATLATAYPAAPPAVMAYTGSLSNGGERVTLSLGADELDSVEYDDAGAWPLSPDGSGPSLELTDPALDNGLASSWAAADPGPTPGAGNSTFGQGTPPSISAAAIGSVAAGQPIAITADVAGATDVSVEVTVGFGEPTIEPLQDDGNQGDGAAGDGRYGGSIPAQPAGTLVRYRVLADAASGSATHPVAGSPRRLLGYVVERPDVDTELPVIDWYVAPDDYQYLLDNYLTNDYVPAVVAVGGEVWDGAQVRVQGNGRIGPKFSFKINMPKGQPLVAPGFLTTPVDEFVLDGDPRDNTGIIAPLAMSIYADGNDLTPQLTKVRVEQNGEFFGLFTFIEEYDGLWRQRTGLDGAGDEQFDPEGNIGVFQDDGSAEALHSRFEKVAPDDDYSRLYELVQAIDDAPTPQRVALIRDLFDVPALVEFLAVNALIQHWDTTVHNFALVRDGSTGRWRFAPADMDFTLGQPLSGVSNPTYFKVSAIFPFGPDTLVSAVRTDPVLSELYFRRLRTLADRYLAGGVILDRAEVLAPPAAAEVALDRTKWGLDYDQAVGLRELGDYVTYRTTDLLTTHRRPGEVPAAPTPGLPVTISAATYAGPGGPGRDVVAITNPAAEAIDLSGWEIQGAGVAQLPPGSVIPAGGTVFVAADQEASAADRPSGALVMGELAEGLADAGGTVTVVDADGATRAQAVLEDLQPVVPGPPPVLAIEASADQVEAAPGDGSGVGFTVVVANRGSGALSSVVVTAPGTTCGRTLGSLAAGSRSSFRCSSTATTGPDRTYLFDATSGSLAARAAPVQVRTLGLRTDIFWQHLSGAPTLGPVVLGPGATLRADVTLPAATNSPVQWMVATGTPADRAVPTQGQLVRPATSVEFDAFAEGSPTRIAVAIRNDAGTGPRSAPTPFLTPRSTVSWPFAGTTALVTRLYTDLEGRPPTPTELASWVAAIDGGTSPSALVSERLAAPRWATTVQPLIRLYSAYFRRPPDPSGLAYWVGRRNKGATLDSISASFAATSEFKRTYGSLDHEAFVTVVYRNVLGRSPDPSGLLYWVRQLQSGRSRGRVMTAFSESSEGRAKLAPITGPSLVWFALIGRPPTATELAPAQEWMAAGGSLLTVIEGVRSSDAYEEKVG